MFEVFHVKRGLETWGFGPKRNFPDDYDFVAKVHCSFLREVFEKTNHIDRNWTENEGIDAIDNQRRSTSVGDVVRDLRTNQYFLCEMVGWSEFSCFPEEVGT